MINGLENLIVFIIDKLNGVNHILNCVSVFFVSNLMMSKYPYLNIFTYLQYILRTFFLF